MADKFVNSSNLQTLWNKIKSTFVPQSRTVNSKALSSDISLDASDVGAVNKAGDTMTGDLGIKGAFDSTQTLSNAQYNPILYLKDKNGVGLGRVAGFRKTSNINGVRIVAERTISGTAKYNVLDLGIDADGNSTVQLSSTSTGTAEAWRNALGVVPTTRTVNSKALSSDITLSASDLDAVPTSRTVNGHALTGNVAVTLSDLKLAMSAAMNAMGFYLNASNYPYLRWTDTSSNNYQLIVGPNKFSYRTQASGGSWVNVFSLEANAVANNNGATVSVATATDTDLCNTGSLSAGTYIFKCCATFASNATGRRTIFLSKSSGGSVINRYARVIQPPVSGAVTQLQMVYMETITSATTFYLRGYQNSGGALNVSDAGIQVIKLHS